MRLTVAASGQFGRKLRGDWPQSLRIDRKKLAGSPASGARSTSTVLLSLFLALCLSGPSALRAQTDCLSCHADKTMQDASGHSVGVDADLFHASIHGSLSCTGCHTSIKEYPHPETPVAVKCVACHADQAAGIAGSVHASASAHPCTSCQGDAHAISAKDDARSAVYPLNIPRTCGTCHASETLAKKYGLQNVYAIYMDSIHG